MSGLSDDPPILPPDSAYDIPTSEDAPALVGTIPFKNGVSIRVKGLDSACRAEDGGEKFVRLYFVYLGSENKEELVRFFKALPGRQPTLLFSQYRNMNESIPAMATAKEFIGNRDPSLSPVKKPNEKQKIDIEALPDELKNLITSEMGISAAIEAVVRMDMDAHAEQYKASWGDVPLHGAAPAVSQPSSARSRVATNPRKEQSHSPGFGDGYW